MRLVHSVFLVAVWVLCGCGSVNLDDPWLQSSSGKADDGHDVPATGPEARGDLIIVHPSRTWDPLAVAAPAIHQLLDRWLDAGRPVHVLRHDDRKLFHPPGSDRRWFYHEGSWVYSSTWEGGMTYPEEVDSYYVRSRPGVMLVASEEGEHAIQPQASDLTVVGGYLNRCLANAVGWSIKQHVELSKASTLRIQIYLPGVFAFTDRKRQDIPDDILGIWPYPVNPGFVRLHKQVGIPDSCPRLSDIQNEMIDNRDEPLEFVDAPMPANLTLSFSCDGAGMGDIDIGQGSTQSVSIDFISARN